MALEAPGACLSAWTPGRWPVADDWQPLVHEFLESPSGRELGAFATDRIRAGARIYPPQPFRALELTPLRSVRVVILGQDPYHGAGQAQGLAFSVAPGVRLPPSLLNIFKELARSRSPGSGSPERQQPAVAQFPVNGSLERWARQGVLLLNTCLTVEDGQPASHANKGWEALTLNIFKAVVNLSRPVVFMLWGAHAQKLAERVGLREGLHRVLTANHPSPLSALRPPQPFIGCGHFEQANRFLLASGAVPIDW